MTSTLAVSKGAFAATGSEDELKHRQGLWGVAGRVAGAVATLVVILLASRSLSRTEFGVWMVLSTLSAVLMFSDLGIANSIVTDLTTAATTRDRRGFQALVSTATGVLILVGGTLVVVSVVVVSSVDLDHLLGTSVRAGFPVATRPAAATFLVSLAVSLPATIGLRILVAMHRADVAGKIAVTTSVVQVMLAGVATVMGAGLVTFSAVAACPAVISGILAWAVAARSWPAAHVKLRAIDRGAARLLWRRGTAYLVIAIAGAIAFETDALVIARALGSNQSADYLVPAKVFLMVPSLLTLYFTPLWPSVARGLARGDGFRLRHEFRRALIRALLVGTLGSLAVVVCLRPALGILAPAVRAPGLALMVTLAALTVVHSVSAPVASFLSGLALVRVQAISAAGMAGANLLMSILLVRSLGLVGPALATAVCQSAFTLAPLTLLIRRTLRHVPR